MNQLCTYADEECENNQLPVPVRFFMDDYLFLRGVWKKGENMADKTIAKKKTQRKKNIRIPDGQEVEKES